MSRTLRVGYFVVWGALLGGLAAETVLVLLRRSEWKSAQRYREANIFAQSRTIAEAAGTTLWLRRGEKYRPGAVLSAEVGGERYEIRINRHGFRTKEFAETKAAGFRRVVCIGGSTTVQGRTNDETYPALLERALNRERPSRPVEVINLGISETGSDYWLERPEELFRLQPDVVVEYEFVNDFFWRYLPRYARLHPLATIARRSLLFERFFPPPAEHFANRFDRTFMRFAQMQEQASSCGAAYLIGSFAGPDAARAEPGLRGYLDQNVESWGGRYGLRRYQDYRAILDAFNQGLLTFARERGLSVAPVEQRLRDPALYVDLCHMTPRGIQALADAFLPSVRAAIDRR